MNPRSGGTDTSAQMDAVRLSWDEEDEGEGEVNMARAERSTRTSWGQVSTWMGSISVGFEESKYRTALIG